MNYNYLPMIVFTAVTGCSAVVNYKEPTDGLVAFIRFTAVLPSETPLKINKNGSCSLGDFETIGHSYTQQNDEMKVKSLETKVAANKMVYLYAPIVTKEILGYANKIKVSNCNAYFGFFVKDNYYYNIYLEQTPMGCSVNITESTGSYSIGKNMPITKVCDLPGK